MRETWNSYKRFEKPYQELIHPSGKEPKKYERSGLADLIHVNNTIMDSTDLQGSLKILEYGCGDCRILRHSSKFPQDTFYGVDLVRDFVEQGKKHHEHTYTLDTLPQKDFDVVFSVSVFIHLNHDDTVEALNYIYNVLRPGGYALLQIPVYEIGIPPKDMMDVGTWSFETLYKLFRFAGFYPLAMYANKGTFSYDKVPGVHHHEFHILSKPDT